MPMTHFDVEFTKEGAVFNRSELDAVVAGLGPVSDLLMLSHGWNNDKADAGQLYDELSLNIEKLLALGHQPAADVPQPLRTFTDRLRHRTFAAVRIYWPSKKFSDSDLIPGGGAATAQAEQENIAAINAILDRLKEDPQRLGDRTQDPARVAKMERAKTLVPALATVAAQQEFVGLLRGLLDSSMAEKDDASQGFFDAAAETLFANASTPVIAPVASSDGGGVALTSGGAAGLGDLLSGVQAAGRRIANFATYYQMKTRAGTVGSKGVAEMLAVVRKAKKDIRLHLVGHSFGGRLVTAAVNELPGSTEAVSLCLLQAAFSHNGFSGGFGDNGTDKGFFRSVMDLKRVSGPIIITHTKNDKAVGIAYPLASRIAGQNASALGDQNDPYGGMGRNGAQHTVEADNSAVMGLPGTAYSFAPGRIHNILADVITGHNDVTRIEVAYAVLSAAVAVS
jgi:pimeloyl-ACP methyl ester carboxylesterase